jgi:thiol-disulfide isomerase/thioredoxin
MKKYFSIILLLCCTQICLSQSRLTGRINGAAAGQVELNISRDIWYQPENSIYAAITAEGSFTFSLPGNDPVFVTLHYNKKEQRLLLSPGRPLHITFEADDLPGTIKYTGKAATENMMIHAFFPPRPFFMKEFSSKNEYGKWSQDSLLNVLLPAITKEADSLRQIVSISSVPADIKKSLITQTKYYYALNMEEFSAVLSSYTKNPAARAWQDTVIRMTGLPSMTELDRSPTAAYFLHAYAKYEMMKLGLVYRKDKAKGSKMLEETIGLPFDSLMQLAGMYGDEVITLMLAQKKLPVSQYERLLSNRLIYYSNDRELSTARVLLSEMNKYFPAGKDTEEGRKRVAKLEASLNEGKRNTQIAFRKDYREISSVEQLLAPYRGKIVYLDIWGTWCGWCKVEMGYVPELKKKMSGKDIVFLYLSHDEDNADKKWREYVQLNRITGEHVRMTKERIKKIWDELLPDEETRNYPTYFIFGRDGKAVVKKAKRPSDGEVLYEQLSELL